MGDIGGIYINIVREAACFSVRNGTGAFRDMRICGYPMLFVRPRDDKTALSKKRIDKALASA